ncbi:MAG: hypothetical protein R3D58_08000 [Saprospiraceae bacterium]|nr:hypothetical protein [Lewinellaceae bacterium]
MKSAFYLSVVTALCFAFSACKKDPAGQIKALEAAYASSNSDAAADSLVWAYKDAVKAHPEKTAENLRYLTNAASIIFKHQKNALGAVQTLNEGLKKYSQDQNLTDPIGLLAQIFYAYQFKTTPDLSRYPDDIDLMRENLEKNTMWLDSSLARIDKELGGAAVLDKAKAEPFLQISESYAMVLEGKDTNRQVNILMKAAGLAKAVGAPNRALRLYYNVAEKLPEHPKAPTALFMTAFIYENDVKDLEKAKSTYELFLERYPNDPDYVDDATQALKFLGMPPEEIIKQFEQKTQ